MADQLETDPLFVGLTRPPMKLGVTQSFFVINTIGCAMLFLATKSFLVLFVGGPLFHALGVLMCLKDPRVFDIAFIKLKCMKSRNRQLWRANSYDPW
jgi:type IV secretion system protein VirB3